MPESDESKSEPFDRSNARESDVHVRRLSVSRFVVLVESKPRLSESRLGAMAKVLSGFPTGTATMSDSSLNLTGPVRNMTRKGGEKYHWRTRRKTAISVPEKAMQDYAKLGRLQTRGLSPHPTQDRPTASCQTRLREIAPGGVLLVCGV